jgi:hypothetical protein
MKSSNNEANHFDWNHRTYIKRESVARTTLNYEALAWPLLLAKHNLVFSLYCWCPTCTCQQYKTVEFCHVHATINFLLLSSCTVNVLRSSGNVSDKSVQFKQIGGFLTDFYKRSKYTIALKPSSGSSAGLWEWKDNETNRHDKANGRFSLFLRRRLKRVLKPALVAGLVPS